MSNRDSLHIERNMRIVQWRALGRTYKVIADHYGLSKERIRQIVSKHARRMMAPPGSKVQVGYRQRWLDVVGTEPPPFEWYPLRATAQPEREPK